MQTASNTTTTQLLDDFRKSWRKQNAGAYNFYLHFAFINCLCLFVVWFAMRMCWQDVHWSKLEIWLGVPCMFFWINLSEYLGHRFPMHHRYPFLSRVYERHTLQHHKFFTFKKMEVDSAHDGKIVLFPPALFLFFLMVFVLPVAIGAKVFVFHHSNLVPCLFVSTCFVYYVLYEWLHMMYHWDQKYLSLFPLLQVLQKHHKLHHHPRHMQNGNFNITFPICDVLFGTMVREE